MCTHTHTYYGLTASVFEWLHFKGYEVKLSLFTDEKTDGGSARIRSWCVHSYLRSLPRQGCSTQLFRLCTAQGCWARRGGEADIQPEPGSELLLPYFSHFHSISAPFHLFLAL